MTNPTATVKIWGDTAGYISMQNNRIFFQYAPEFLKRGIELSPIRVPLNKRVYNFTSLNNETFKGLPGFIADSLPDKFGTIVKHCGGTCHIRHIPKLTCINRRQVGTKTEHVVHICHLIRFEATHIKARQIITTIEHLRQIRYMIRLETAHIKARQAGAAFEHRKHILHSVRLKTTHIKAR